MSLPSIGIRRSTIVVLVLLSITLLTLDLRGSSLIDTARNLTLDATAPLRSAGGTVATPFQNAWNGVFHYGDLARENDELRAKIEAQEGVSIAAEAQIRDYQELLQANQLPYLSQIPTVVARVIGEPPSNWDLTVEIDQGASKGIRVGMTVVTPAGLVGRITRVTDSRSVVRLISDPEVNVGVKIVGQAPAATAVPPATAPAAPGTTAKGAPKAAPTTAKAPASTAAPATALPPAALPSDPSATTAVPTTTPAAGLVALERGILHGEGRGQELSVDLIDADAPVAVGDPVVTSGVDTSLAPADIPVGRVSAVKRTAGSFQLDVRVTPAADLEHLTFVTVLLYSPGP